MQRRNVDLPEPDGPEHAAHLAGADLQVDALEHLQRPERLVHLLGPDHHAVAAVARPRAGVVTCVITDRLARAAAGLAVIPRSLICAWPLVP